MTIKRKSKRYGCFSEEYVFELESLLFGVIWQEIGDLCRTIAKDRYYSQDAIAARLELLLEKINDKKAWI